MTVTLLAFAASLRKGSFNRKLIQVAAGIARELGAEVDLAEFSEFEMPLFNADINQATGLPSGALEFIRRLQANDGMLIASPEYNYSVNGVLKNALDWVSRAKPTPLNGRTALLMSTSSGIYGGIRGLWQLRIPLEGCGCFVHPGMFPLSTGGQAFSADGGLIDSAQHTRLHSLMSGYLKAAEALAAIRT